jgi:hypothetical protein
MRWKISRPRERWGLIEQPIIDGAKAGPEHAQQVFETEFAERVQKLPYETVQNEVKSQKAWFEILSVNFLTGMVEQQYDTLAQDDSQRSRHRYSRRTLQNP